MKKLFVRIIATVLLSIGVVGGIGFTQVALASNDSISFSFKIYSFWQNGKEKEGRYRQTDDINNPWKVRLDKSGEGAGTISEFWLENASASNVSSVRAVKQGNGAYYDNPFYGANKTTVWLTGQNNNYNGDMYNVSGIWDEETWGK